MAKAQERRGGFASYCGDCEKEGWSTSVAGGQYQMPFSNEIQKLIARYSQWFLEKIREL
jgi:hypothetical protein